MPIETERPGVFRGVASNRTQWFVIDPSASEGLREARVEWEEHVAPSNRPRWRRVLGPLVGWAVFVVGCVGIVVALVAADNAAAGVLGAVGFLIVALIAAVVGSGISSVAFTDGQTSSVLPILAVISDGVSDDISVADLWELNLHCRRVVELQEASAYLVDPNDEDRPANAEWALSAVVQPAIDAELSTRRAALEQTAARVGFPVSELPTT